MEESSMLKFPDGFLWGTATAAYQIEGAYAADGKGPSIWDTFSHLPGTIERDENGDVACDHYHRYREDVALMAELGLQRLPLLGVVAARHPRRHRAANQAGLDFYSRLVDELLARQIRPFITLYHWDLPQAMEDRGGWGARDTAAAFGDYAALMGRTLGDRVKDWITLNEPLASTTAGYIFGIHPPGKRDPQLAFQVSHHLESGARPCGPRPARDRARSHVGITEVSMPVYPATDSEADRQAAQRYDGVVNRWYWDPPLRGSYPADIIERLGPLAPTIADGDLALVSPPIDFLGHNSYSRAVVKDDPSSLLMGATPVPQDDKPKTEMGWEVYPDHLYDALTRITRDYNAPDIYITENGAAYVDAVVNGAVNDPQRVDYLRTHLAAAHRAIQDGVKLRGYFCWSLLDNFEWSFGYSKRFGIVYVDYPTQQRIVKASGRFFGEVARRNGLA